MRFDDEKLRTLIPEEEEPLIAREVLLEYGELRNMSMTVNVDLEKIKKLEESQEAYKTGTTESGCIAG